MLSFIQNQILSLASFKERVQIVIPHNKAIVPATFSATEIGSSIFLSDLPELLLHKILSLDLSGHGEESDEVTRARRGSIIRSSVVYFRTIQHS